MAGLIYLTRHWDENRGDEFNHWGTSNWYFETDLNGEVLRQIEEYEIGVKIWYNLDKDEDKFGGLSQVPIDLNDNEFIKISELEFNQKWLDAINQTIDDNAC